MPRFQKICLLLAVSLYSWELLPGSAVAQTEDAGERKTLLYVARHLSAADLANALGAVLKSIDPEAGTVVAEPVTNHVFVTANQATLEKVTKILAQVDRPPKMVAIDVQLIQFSREVDAEEPGPAFPTNLGLSGPTKVVQARLRALEKGGKIEFCDQVKLSTLENQPAFLQVGQQKHVVTGVQQYVPGSSSRSFSRPAIKSYRDVNVGLIVKVIPRVTPDGLVAMELRAEKSWLVPAGAASNPETDDAGPSAIASTTETTSVEATVSVARDQTVLAGGMIHATESTQTTLLILVTASISG